MATINELSVRLAVLETKMDAAENSRARTHKLMDKIGGEMTSIREELHHINGFEQKAAAYGLHKGTEDQIRFVLMFWRWALCSKWGRSLLGTLITGLLYLLTMAASNHIL